ncbi:MAG TPA: hypothetical protein VGC16_02490 [Rhizomicrobium sp.]
MFQDSWALYEAPRPKKWMFHPQKRRIMPSLLTIMAAGFVIFEAVSRF